MAILESQLWLRFDGVDSAYYVWVNKVLVEYAQGSRNTSEFDATEHAHRDGPNEVWVRVYQWWDGTYIKDQDQWWLSNLDAQYRNATLQPTVDVLAKQSGTVALNLYELSKNGGAVIGATEATVTGDGKVELSLGVQEPQKWTAETPYLYQVELSLQNPSGKPYTVQQRIGFRKVELINELMTVNGVPIQLRGVNRHEHHPLFGRAVPMEFIKRDRHEGT
ncbi:glycosyl hydrolases family 2, sugar binding domain-containing protein [Mariannaea sp. PMI_226]|nr:glycosyl hydrolases family 2, sugar binding domain-containing protein [Mariannaea sp. PMI_226]